MLDWAGFRFSRGDQANTVPRAARRRQEALACAVPRSPEKHRVGPAVERLITGASNRRTQEKTKEQSRIGDVGNCRFGVGQARHGAKDAAPSGERRHRPGRGPNGGRCNTGRHRHSRCDHSGLRRRDGAGEKPTEARERWLFDRGPSFRSIEKEIQ